MSTAARHETVTRWRNKIEREHGHGRQARKRRLMTDRLSADLAVFLAEHERFGDLDTGVDGGRAREGVGNLHVRGADGAATA